MKDTPPIKFGYVLRDLRTYHDYTQKDLSDYLNITTQAYSNYERDERTPDLETLYKIAQFYKISLAQLVNYCSDYTDRIQEPFGYSVSPSIFRANVTPDITYMINLEWAKLFEKTLPLPKETQDSVLKVFNCIIDCVNR